MFMIQVFYLYVTVYCKILNYCYDYSSHYGH